MIKEFLRKAVTQQASDIHITAGLVPVFRINGSLVHTTGAPLTRQDTLDMFQEITSAEQQLYFQNNYELDFAFAIDGCSRFRVNAYHQRGSVAMAIRVIKNRIASLEELGMPEIVKTLARMPRGLILVTGPTGSGKSTTLAAMLDLINRERAAHVLTLEEPIEYLHDHGTCVINQREIPTDSKSFICGLKAALREDPDVIMVGEMRDAETVGTVMTAAETGHLVLASLHTYDCAQSIDRIIDVFPTHQQAQMRSQLSMTLQGIVAQQLLARKDGSGRVVAVETLIATPAVRNLIREGKIHQIASCIQTGARYGMQTMDFSLKALYQQGLVSYADALDYAMDKENFIRLANC